MISGEEEVISGEEEVLSAEEEEGDKWWTS